MKEFLIYTGLRILLFLASAGVVGGIWLLFSGEAPIFWIIVIAFVASGVGSYFLLDRQRQALAERVEDRARRATAKMEEMKSKEDVD